MSKDLEYNLNCSDKAMPSDAPQSNSGIKKLYHNINPSFRI